MARSRGVVRFLFLLFVLFFALSLSADGTLYGLRNPGDAGRQLVTIAPATGTVTPIGASIDPPNGTPSGVVALDLGGGRFFFVGTPGVETTMRLYTLDLATGAALSSPTIEAGTAILGLEYDEDEDVLYGLRNPGDGGKQLVALDVTTGIGTPISASIAPPLGIPSGVNAIDAAGNRFFFIGTPSGEMNQRIYTVDTATGAVLSSPAVASTGVLHLEYDAAEGLLYAVQNPGDAGKQLIALDPATGTITPRSLSFDAPLGVASGVNALDASLDAFYFMGHRDGETDWRLYAIDTATGALLGSPLIVGSGSQFFVGLALTEPPPPPPVLTVLIDVQPAINVKAKGVIPVAILTTSAFDATTVDASSVRFGPGNASEAHGTGHVSDVDGDGNLDLMLHFRTQDAAIPCGATTAALTGQTLGGQSIQGSDAIRTVGCQ
jgi:hypothetical protein